MDAVRRIFSSLVRAFINGGDEAAREEMAIAAYEAGVCISNASVTIVHGMSRPIGARFHVPHGLSNAMLLSRCPDLRGGGQAGQVRGPRPRMRHGANERRRHRRGQPAD